MEGRKQERIEVGWSATCTVDATRVAGTILDISVSGGFLGLRAATNPAQPPFGLTTISKDETGALSFSLAGEETTEIPITVRWVGYSQTHGCHGIGFEFAAVLTK